MKIWEHNDAIITAWKIGIKASIPNPTMKILKVPIKVIRQSLTLF
jgi:hypothetical protein